VRPQRYTGAAHSVGVTLESKTGINPRVPFVVKADPLLQPLIPDYLRNRRNDLQKIADALTKRDLAALRKLGHDMAGSGGAYGIPPISDIGRTIENAALASDTAAIAVALEDLRVFLDMVKLPP
jgi:HPt (histidine-containing phosphotransfer) domain-containing protein